VTFFPVWLQGMKLEQENEIWENTLAGVITSGTGRKGKSG
jgi:hypothetical protein